MQTSHAVDIAAACRRMTRWVLIVSAIGIIIYSMILAPLETQMAANVLYNGSIWLTVIYLLRQIIEPIVFFMVYPALFYALWLGRWKGARGGILAFASLTLVKYIVNFAATCISDGALPGWNRFVKVDLPLILPTILLELLQHTLVVLIAVLVLYVYRRIHSPATDDDDFLQSRVGVFPFSKMISWKNPLQLSTMLATLLMLAGRLIMHALYQLTLLFYNGATNGWKVIFFDVISDVVICMVGYFVMILLLSMFDRCTIVRTGTVSPENKGQAKKSA